MLQSKKTLCNQQISLPNTKRKVTMKTCQESLLGKTSPKSISATPPFFTSVSVPFLHFYHHLIMLIYYFSFSNYLWLLNTQKICFNELFTKEATKQIQAWPLWGTGLCPFTVRHSQECFSAISGIIPASGILCLIP